MTNQFSIAHGYRRSMVRRDGPQTPPHSRLSVRPTDEQSRMWMSQTSTLSTRQWAQPGIPFRVGCNRRRKSDTKQTL